MKKTVNTFRVSMNSTDEDWKEFRELSKKYGWTVSSLFTKMFDDSLKFMRENTPQIDDIEVPLNK